MKLVNVMSALLRRLDEEGPSRRPAQGLLLATAASMRLVVSRGGKWELTDEGRKALKSKRFD